MRNILLTRSLYLLLLLIGFSYSAHSQCAGNCGTPTVGNCGCDSDCWLYGDCCPDIEASCPDIRPTDPPVSFPGNGGGGVTPLACNSNVSICTPGVAGPFNFDGSSPGPPVDYANPVGCSTGLFGNDNDFGFIILNITGGGALNLLVDGSSNTGFIDVVVYNIPPGQNPCVAVMNSANEIGCNYAPAAVGCTQFGTSLPGCTSSVPAPNVTAGQQLMIIVHDYSDQSNSFTLQLGPNGATTGPPNATINPVPSPCVNSAPVAITAVSNGGTWSGPGMSANGMFNPATAGVGTHTIGYSVGQAPCNASSTTQITVTPAQAAAFTTNSPVCATQTLIFTPTPIPGATYHWSGPGGWTSTSQNPTRPNATAAMSGNYNLYMVVGGCTTSTATQAVLVNATAPAPAISTNAPVCHGYPITFDGPSPVPGGEYHWSGPNSWASALEDPAIPNSDYSMTGQYSMYMVINGCTSAVANLNVEVTVPPKPVIEPMTPRCFESPGVNMVVDLPNGTWTGTGVTPAGLFDPTVAGTGTHQLIYTIPEPCGSADTTEVMVTAPLSMTGEVTNETCPEVGDGMIDLTVNGATGPLTYLWNNSGATEDAIGIILGTYWVTVTDQYGCAYNSPQFQVFAGSSLNFSYTTQDVLCNGDPTGQIHVTPLSGIPPYTYTVNGYASATSPIGNLHAGPYTVILTDSKGCDTTFTTQINEPPALFADSTHHQIQLGTSLTLNPTYGGGNGNLNLLWVPAYNLGCNDCPHPLAWPERNVEYTITVTDANGCVETGQVTVDVYHDGPFIPNAFTPGKDELNNTWLISDYGVETFDVIVFDRWGSKVFQTDNIYEGWDGKLKNGNFYEGGVYVYRTSIRYIDGTEKTLLGHLTLMR